MAVDDEAGVGALLQRVFEETGRYAFAFENEALSALRRARLFRPDILLLDVNMPGIDGIQIATLLRTEPWLRYRPIVFFTGSGERALPAALTLGDGPTEFLTKGVSSAVIVQTVDRLLAV